MKRKAILGMIFCTSLMFSGCGFNYEGLLENIGLEQNSETDDEEDDDDDTKSVDKDDDTNDSSGKEEAGTDNNNNTDNTEDNNELSEEQAFQLLVETLDEYGRNDVVKLEYMEEGITDEDEIGEPAYYFRAGEDLSEYFVTYYHFFVTLSGDVYEMDELTGEIALLSGQGSVSSPVYAETKTLVESGEDLPYGLISISFALEGDKANGDAMSFAYGEENEYQVDLLITTNDTLSDFSFMTLEMKDFTDDYYVIYEANTEYISEYFISEIPFILTVTFNSDMPEYAIDFRDSNGDYHAYAINLSGEDGQPYFISLVEQ